MRKTLEWIDKADPFDILILCLFAGLVAGMVIEFIRDAVRNK